MHSGVIVAPKNPAIYARFTLHGMLLLRLRKKFLLGLTMEILRKKNSFVYPSREFQIYIFSIFEDLKIKNILRVRGFFQIFLNLYDSLNLY